MSTGRATLTGIFGCNNPHRNACQSRLVLNHVSKLCETPIAVPASLFAPHNPCPLANTLKVFEVYCPLRALGVLNDTFGNHMIRVPLEAGLFTGKLFEFALGFSRATLLEAAAGVVHPLASALHRFTAVENGVTVYRKVYNAHVNAKRVLGFLFGWGGNITGRQQVPFPAAVHEVAFAFLVAQQFKLAFVRLIGNTQAPANTPNTDALLVGVPLQNTVIVGNRAMLAEFALRVLVQFVSIAHFGNYAHNHLRGQIKTSLDFAVHQLLQLERAEGFAFPRLRTNVVAGS